jgi:broad specificity phosphatase PhoE
MCLPVPEQTVYTLRHAAIDFGRQHIIAGRLDPPINAEGIEQIRKMASAGVPLDFHHVISSPQQRAFETARRVTGLAAHEIITSYLCMERNYGKLEGVKPADLASIQPATFYVTVGNVEHSLNPPGGETLEQLRERVITFHELVRSIERKNLLIVSHGVFLQQYHGYLRGLDVYHSLHSSVAYLELNKFCFEGDVLTSDERVYRPELLEEPW